MELVQRPPPAGGKQVAWRIVRNVITHALDYDSRVLTSSLVLPHAAAVESRAWRVVEAIVGKSLTEQQKTQVQLPTSHGGCQMPMPTTLVPVARAADLMEVGLHVRHAVVSWGFSLETAKEADGVSDAISEGLLSMLAERRVTFDHPGHPAILGSEAAAALTADVLRPAAETRHVMSAMLKVVAEANYQQLLASGGRDSTRIPSAGGPNAEKSLTAPAGLKTTHFGDEEFTEIVCWRLGIAPQAEPTLCQNVAANNERCCDEVMNKHCDHAMCCSNGPLRIRRHEDVAEYLADVIDDTGAHVRREAYIKAFTTADSEAWLDIWAFEACTCLI